jgi:hypothetical protein
LMRRRLEQQAAAYERPSGRGTGRMAEYS